MRPQANAWGVWMYALTGAGTTVAFGATSLYIGSFLAPKKQRSIQTDTSDVHDQTAGGSAKQQDMDVQGWNQLSSVLGLDSFGRSVKKANEDELTLTQTVVGGALLCSGLFLLNMRTVSTWKGRKIRGNLDAEAFLRGFDKFMNEQAGKSGSASEGRAGAGPEARQRTREEFEKFWEEFERDEAKRRRMYEQFNQRYTEREREHRETFSGSAQDHWQSPQVRDALQQLGLSPGAALTSKALKSAYLSAAKASHPDRVPEADKAAAGERFKKVSEAYAVLRMQVVTHD